MMPACSHVGTPRHFQSSTTSGTTWWIRARTLARVFPRQSPRSSIRSSISEDGVLVSLAFAAGDFSVAAVRFAAARLVAVFVAVVFLVVVFLVVVFLAGGMRLLASVRMGFR